ncbi:MAG: hypothetical protein HY042_01945 [Spirochaetia bacterium]|nr:hypothetical protein [Spirochaetia bacterium]
MSMVRDLSLFKWYVIPLFALVVYVYSVEIERKNWNLVLAGVTVAGIDWMLEIINSLFLHFSQFSAVWTEVGPTAYQIFVGLNIETYLMFCILGIVFGKLLPPDKNMKILGIPNRWFLGAANSLFCVFVEIILNKANVLIWNYSWWNFPNIPLIVIFGYSLYFFGSYYVIDVPDIKKKIMVPAALWVVNIPATIVLIAIGWI